MILRYLLSVAPLKLAKDNPDRIWQEVGDSKELGAAEAAPNNIHLMLNMSVQEVLKQCRHILFLPRTKQTFTAHHE